MDDVSAHAIDNANSTISQLITNSPLYISPDENERLGTIVSKPVIELDEIRPTIETESATHQSQSKKAWFDLQFHDVTKIKIKKPDEIDQSIVDPRPISDSLVFDKIAGSIFALAIGDALGAHVEFRPHDYLADHPVTDLTGGGTWGLEKGQFTDDTSMALCLANSLIACRGFNLYDQLVRYKWWYRHGYMSSTGQCFDIGNATRESIEQFEQRQQGFAQTHHIPLEQIDSLSDANLLKQFDVNCSKDGVAGNGALMRLAPVPLFFFRHPPTAVDFAGQSGQVTHGDQKAIDACRYYAALIVAALHGESQDELLHDDFYTRHQAWFGDKELHVDIMNISQGSYKKRGGYDEGIRGGGYVVPALEAALWAFWSTSDFEAGALAAVNLGDDTDTTAAIYGQLAGAVYGLAQLPARWIEEIYAKAFLMTVAREIVHKSDEWQPEHRVILQDLSESPYVTKSSYDQCLKWSSEDVATWIRSLKPVSNHDGEALLKASIDGPSLLFKMNMENLTRMGIVDEEYQQTILSSIEQMKSNVSSEFYKHFDEEDDFVRLEKYKATARWETSDEVERCKKTFLAGIETNGTRLIHNADQYRTFLQQILWIEHNHNPQMPDTTIAESEREKMFDRLQHFKRETRHQRDEKVCIVRGWYRCGHEQVSEIENHGFRNLFSSSSKDNNQGLRFKASARSAAKDAASGDCLVMCYIILRNPFPTIIDDPAIIGFPHRYRYYSEGQHSIYQYEHQSMTNRPSITYFPPSEEVNHGNHDEFVTYQFQDILPQMIVYLRSPSTNLQH